MFSTGHTRQVNPAIRVLAMAAVFLLVSAVSAAWSAHADTLRPGENGSSAVQTQILGLDVSSHQGNVDWQSVAAKGARFAYVKATEGTGYVNSYFAQQYNGSYAVGLVRGAYHFALPNVSSAAAQADYFVRHGGGWSADGRTLPPAMDIEQNPYSGGVCYGLGQREMISWVKSFSDRVRILTGRWPTIYTAATWWTKCTGGLAGFSGTNPLWIPRYGADAGPMPYDWRTYTFWQYADSGPFPGGQDYFNGSYSRLLALAAG
jgi:GH25 family lysozyme M1 (1,4-beta-N-acetylmuramidase)